MVSFHKIHLNYELFGVTIHNAPVHIYYNSRRRHTHREILTDAINDVYAGHWSLTHAAHVVGSCREMMQHTVTFTHKSN